MTAQFRNREDTRRYAAAEDAFTSEGGHLAEENEGPGERADAGSEIGQLSNVFKRAAGRYATEMRHVLTVFRGGSAHPATRTANRATR